MQKVRSLFRLLVAVLSLGAAAVLGLLSQSWIVKHIHASSPLREVGHIDTTLVLHLPAISNSARPQAQTEHMRLTALAHVPEIQREYSTTTTHVSALGVAAKKARRKCQICKYINVNRLAPRSNTSRIGSARYIILTVGNSRLFRQGGDLYSIWRTWGCYGNRLGIPIRALDPNHVLECSSFSNEWFFRRVCTIRVVIQALQEEDNFGGLVGVRELDLVEQPTWVLTLDGDCIVHSHVALGDIFQRSISQDVVIYERFFNGEIHAGNMGLRVTPWVVSFLRGWQEYHALNYFNADNGVLHIHLLKMLRLSGGLSHSKEVEKQLQNRLALVKNIQTYDKFIAWVKLLLGPKRLFKNVLILRRGMAFCIDAYVAKFFYSHGNISGRFLCLHGVKNRQSVLKKYGPTCTDFAEDCGSSLHDCAQKDTLSDGGLTQIMRQFRSDRQGLGGINDVSDCWPDCAPEISDTVWRLLEAGLNTRKSNTRLP